MSSRSLLRWFVPLLGAPLATCSGDARDQAPPERIGATAEAASVAPFLTYKTPPQYLGLNNPTAEDEASQYYQTWGAPSSLDDFRGRWGFDQEGVDVAGAVYFNAGDLGIGRLMRCVGSSSGARACYVENYGEFGGNARAALDLAVSRQGSFAAVAMTYEPSRGDSAVNFVVYGPSGDLARSAQLDKSGANPAIPFNCTSCHGGTYDPSTHVMTGGRFLPFDMDTFEFANYDGYGRDDQAYEIQRLNAHVYTIASEQNVSPIVETIDGWYGGTQAVFSPQGVAFRGHEYIPPDWVNAGHDNIYRAVIAPYCQGCHLVSTVDLRKYDRLLSAVSAVCQNQTMPAAEVPMRRFWSDSNAQQVLVSAHAPGSVTCNRPDFL